ncbi:hypothetical protein T439DRAFT_379964 [Meredithblackwellia eburnea MCA 4105]
MRTTITSFTVFIALLVQSVVGKSSHGWSVEIGQFSTDCESMYLDVSFPKDFGGATSGSLVYYWRLPDHSVDWYPISDFHSPETEQFILPLIIITQQSVVNFRIGDSETSPESWAARSDKGFAHSANMHNILTSVFIGIALLVHTVVGVSSNGWSVEIGQIQPNCESINLDVTFPNHFGRAKSASFAVFLSQGHDQDNDDGSVTTTTTYITYTIGPFTNSKQNVITVSGTEIGKIIGSQPDSAVLSFRVGDSNTPTKTWAAMSDKAFSVASWKDALQSSQVGNRAEVLQPILLLLDPCDLSSFSQLNKHAHQFCSPSSNPHLWREMFEAWFDPLLPSDSARLGNNEEEEEREEDEYSKLLKARIQARGLVNLARQPGQITRAISAFPPILSVLISLHSTSPNTTSLNIDFLSQLFPATSTAFLGEYLAAYADPTGKRLYVEQETRRDAAHLSCLFGPTVRSYENWRRLFALRRTYDVRNYRKETRFGPMEPVSTGAGGGGGGELKVDWIILDALRIVMDFNIMVASERDGWGINPRTEQPLKGVGRGKGGGWRDSARRIKVGERDWAGVEAVWIGTYAYLDWEVFEALNSSEERNAMTLHLSDFREAIGDLMELKLKLDPLPLSPNSSTPYPLLTFTGTLGPHYTQGGPGTPPTGPILDVSGSVSRSSSESATLWQYRVRYNGAIQWALEGVQVGQPGSRAGVRGVWTHASRLFGANVAEGPCGPFSWWPELKEEEEGF